MIGQGVIFDMDGVLVDSYQAHFVSWQRMGAKRGLDLTEAQFAETFGRTTREIIQAVWPGQFAAEDIPLWDACKEAHYREIISADFPEMAGAGELLAALQQAGAAMAIGSSGSRENVDVVLANLPHAWAISAAVTGADVTRGKPEPDVFLLAAEKIGLPPARCVVIEDAPAGVEAARRAGMAVVAMTGTAPRETLAARAHRVVDSLDELTAPILSDLIDRSR